MEEKIRGNMNLVLKTTILLNHQSNLNCAYITAFSQDNLIFQQ